MFLFLIGFIASIFSIFIFWWIGVDIFGEAYNSWNFVKFIVSMFFFWLIPAAISAIIWILSWISDVLDRSKEAQRQKEEEEKQEIENRKNEIFERNMKKEEEKKGQIEADYYENSRILREDAEKCRDGESWWDYFMELYNTKWVEYTDLVAKFLDYTDTQEIFDIWEEERIAEEV